MYESFDVGFEIKSVFLDVSKTFDEVAGLYHLQTNSKWNIEEYTKPFAGFFFKGKKSLYLGKYQYWSTSRFHPWSFAVFYLH